MILRHPIEITSRLLPGVKVGDAYISIRYSSRPGDDNRFRYHYFIDLPGGVEHENDDMQSGCGCGNLLNGLADLLRFLSACGADYASGMGEDGWGENADLFPSAVGAWAAENQDELSSLQCELEETETILIEE